MSCLPTLPFLTSTRTAHVAPPTHLSTIRLSTAKVSLVPIDPQAPRVQPPKGAIERARSFGRWTIRLFRGHDRNRLPLTTELLKESLAYGNWTRVSRLITFESTLANWQDEHGRTPLHIALDAGNLAAARDIVGTKFARNLLDRDGRSAVDHLEALKTDEKAVWTPASWIAPQAPSDAVNIASDPPAFLELMDCLQAGDTWRFESLLSRPGGHAAMINHRDLTGRTLLRHAVDAKQTGIVAVLARHPSTRDLPDEHGRFASEVTAVQVSHPGLGDAASRKHPAHEDTLQIAARWHHDRQGETAREFLHRPVSRLAATPESLLLEFNAMCQVHGLRPMPRFAAEFTLSRLQGQGAREIEGARQLLRHVPRGIPLDSSSLLAALYLAQLHDRHGQAPMALLASDEIQAMRQSPTPPRELQLLEVTAFLHPRTLQLHDAVAGRQLETLRHLHADKRTRDAQDPRDSGLTALDRALATVSTLHADDPDAHELLRIVADIGNRTHASRSLQTVLRRLDADKATAGTRSGTLGRAEGWWERLPDTLQTSESRVLCAALSHDYERLGYNVVALAKEVVALIRREPERAAASLKVLAALAFDLDRGTGRVDRAPAHERLQTIEDVLGGPVPRANALPIVTPPRQLVAFPLQAF